MPLDKGSLMPPQHRWHAEMGEGRLNRNPFPLGAESWSALNTDRACSLTPCLRNADIGGEEEGESVKNELPDLKFKKKKKERDELHRFVISNRYDTTFN